jgi:hypothetical protein
MLPAHRSRWIVGTVSQRHELQPVVLPWTETAYTYAKREDETEGKRVYLGGRTSPVATAKR